MGTARKQSLIAADRARLLMRFNALCILASKLILMRVLRLNMNGAINYLKAAKNFTQSSLEDFDY